MKSSALIAMAIAASLVMGACNNSGKGSVNEADSANKAKVDSGTVSLNKDEAQFMVKAANGGMTEVKLGQLAQEKTRNQRVKDFAAMMVRDHSAADSQLKSLASSKNITLPDSLSEDSKDKLQDLSKKKRSDFDKAYMKMMLDDHQNDVKDFQDELKNIRNSSLKQWVSNTLPTLEMHLDSAKSINKMFGNFIKTGQFPGTTVF